VKLEHSFDVQAPLRRVWEEMIDLERVPPCLPGGEVSEAGDGSTKGTFTVKLGPTTAAYPGKLEMERVDESSHWVTMRASGRGGMIEDFSNRLLGDFVGCLRSSIEQPGGDAEGAEGPAPAPRADPIHGPRLFFSVLWARIRRFLRSLFGRES
jgi:hypothetical protein